MDQVAHADVGTVRCCEPLHRHATWRIGGPADLWVEPHSVQHVVNFVRTAGRAGVPYVVVGSGSNLLFDDAGLRGAVLALGRNLAAFRIEGTRVWSQAGVAVPRLARNISRAGLTGMEYAVGVPGTLGGLVAMNGGSLRRSIGEFVRAVTVVTPAGDVRAYSQEECDFAYRHSRFQGSRDIIVEAALDLEWDCAEAIRLRMLDILRTRRVKFPRREPNCGSVFASGGEMYERFGPPGKVVEDTGCKGWREGGAVVSPQHANFIVNKGGATSADVLRLIHRVREAVHARTGLWLQCEVKHISQSGQVMSAHAVHA